MTTTITYASVQAIADQLVSNHGWRAVPMRAEKCVAGGWISLGLDGTVTLLARRHVTGYPMADHELGSIDLTAPTAVAVANILILTAA